MLVVGVFNSGAGFVGLLTGLNAAHTPAKPHLPILRVIQYGDHIFGGIPAAIEGLHQSHRAAQHAGPAAHPHNGNYLSRQWPEPPLLLLLVVEESNQERKNAKTQKEASAETESIFYTILECPMRKGDKTKGGARRRDISCTYYKL